MKVLVNSSISKAKKRRGYRKVDEGEELEQGGKREGWRLRKDMRKRKISKGGRKG